MQNAHSIFQRFCVRMPIDVLLILDDAMPKHRDAVQVDRTHSTAKQSTDALVYAHGTQCTHIVFVAQYLSPPSCPFRSFSWDCATSQERIYHSCNSSYYTWYSVHSEGETGTSQSFNSQFSVDLFFVSRSTPSFKTRTTTKLNWSQFRFFVAVCLYFHLTIFGQPLSMPIPDDSHCVYARCRRLMFMYICQH